MHSFKTCIPKDRLNKCLNRGKTGQAKNQAGNGKNRDRQCH